MASNPYYDCSDNSGGGGGGSNVDLSDYPKKSEVKNYDEVDFLTSDTKKEGTVYIKANGSLWIWNGSKYIKTSGDDKQIIPIVRLNSTENNHPAISEVVNYSTYTNSIAVIYLSNGVVEYWQYNGTAWQKKHKIQRTVRHFSVFRESDIEQTKPTLAEIGAIPINGDIAVIYLQKDNNPIGVERWKYTSDWSRTNIFYSKNNRVKEVANTSPYTIAKTSRFNIYNLTSTSTGLYIKLPKANDVAGKIYTFKLDKYSNGNNVTIAHSDNDSAKIDDENSYSLLHRNDSVSVISDGDNWQVIHEVINMDLEGRYDKIFVLWIDGDVTQRNGIIVTEDAQNCNIDTTGWVAGDTITIRNQNSSTTPVKVANKGNYIASVFPTCTGRFYFDGNNILVDSVDGNKAYAQYFANHVEPFGTGLDAIIYSHPVAGRISNIYLDSAVMDENINAPLMMAGDGINGRSLVVWKNRKNIITKNGWGIEKRSFVLGGWFKIESQGYFLGMNSTISTQDKNLHFGWRDNNNFTLDFYANGVNWTNPAGLTRDGSARKWHHFIVRLNYSNRRATLFVNGVNCGAITMKPQVSDARLRLEMFGGAMGNSTSGGFFSNIRLYRDYNNGAILSDKQIVGLYEIEKEVLEGI